MLTSSTTTESGRIFFTSAAVSGGRAGASCGGIEVAQLRMQRQRSMTEPSGSAAPSMRLSSAGGRDGLDSDHRVSSGG